MKNYVKCIFIFYIMQLTQIDDAVYDKYTLVLIVDDR